MNLPANNFLHLKMDEDQYQRNKNEEHGLDIEKNFLQNT
jgi:hypothetical protein